MSPKEKLTKYLELKPEARERKNKDKYLLEILTKKYPDVAKNLIEIVHEYTLLDRYWRKILEEREELRGKDYNDKVALEQEKILELGYEVGYTEDIKPKNKYQAFDDLVKSGEFYKKN